MALQALGGFVLPCHSSSSCSSSSSSSSSSSPRKLMSLSPPFPSPRRHLGTDLAGRLPKRTASAASTAAADVSVLSHATKSLKLTYLEINSWLWDVAGVSILVDPVLVGNLDFGAPWLFDGAKKVLRNFKLDDLPELDCLLITQSLDDHCHARTLNVLSKTMRELPVIATANAEVTLGPLFSNVTYLEPGQSSVARGKNGEEVEVFATAGPVLGPPWQRPENGYIIKLASAENSLSLYYEPHCVYNQSFLESCQADVVITPVVKQLLPSFTLVSGQEDAVQLAKLLKAKYMVPMRNGDLDTKGILATILSIEGTVERFKELLWNELPDTQVLEPTPGVELEISVLQA